MPKLSEVISSTVYDPKVGAKRLRRQAFIAAGRGDLQAVKTLREQAEHADRMQKNMKKRPTSYAMAVRG